MGTRCPQCLSENQDQSKFCAECGTKLPFAEDSPFTRTLVKEPPLKAPARGTIFAERYTIVGELGRGGMGVVYKAEDSRLKRTVALKFLPPELVLIPEAKERFLREAQSAAALSHHNICTIHEVEEADGQPYIAMEYIEGENLGQRTKRGPLAGDEAADIAVQIADGLEAAHQRGIVHRDIKPANIMVTEKGRAKIMDFGLAQVAGGSRLTKEATTIGTIAYMSPEQARGEELDRRTDIWSFGVVLYEMLTGQLPFRGDRESIILHSIMEAEPKPARLINPAMSVELQKIIDRALRKKREDRYPSAAEMSRDLRRYLDSRRAEEAGFFNLRSLARRMRRPAYYVPAAALLVALGAFVYWRVERSAKVRWARQVALPQVEKLVQANDFTAAYKLTQEVAKSIANDPQVREYMAQLTGSLSIITDPPGAQVFVKDYAAPDSDFEPYGITPLDNAVGPIGYKRWKIVKAGFEPVEGAGQILPARYTAGANPVRKVTLDAKSILPAGMARVPGQSGFAATLSGAASMPPLQIDDFFLDKTEVTNIEYKRFVDDGGYKRQEFWKQAFIRDGKAVPWEQAMRTFVDKTGRPGPATWEFGQPPDGREDFPVSGVSWYEAAAYAEYAGKVLPTVYHWALSSGDYYVDSGYIVPLSNFSQKDTMPAGKMPGMSPVGIYDLAGNVKEWCSNETAEGKRTNVGGGWDEPSYMFAMFDAYSAWSRYPDFGFRCMKYTDPAIINAEALKPVPLEAQQPFGDLKPCSDETFKLYMKPYEYPQSPLNAKVERQVDVNRNTLFEEVSFDPAYMGDRSGAFIFLPKAGRGPFQTVVHWPGGDSLRLNSFQEYAPYDTFDYLIKTGRAVVIPIIRGTFGRKITPEMRAKTTPLERRAMQVKDFRRTLDYLATRPEFDVTKLAFEGLSWGGGMGSIIPGIEQRIRAIVLIGAGFYYGNPPDYNPINLAPRITAPVLIQNGRYDFFVSIDKELRPLMRIFGTPERDKALKLYEAGHAVWLKMEQQKDEIDFLDKSFGPAK